MFELFKRKTPAPVAPAPPKRFPPVPNWRPSFTQSLDRIADRVAHYCNRTRDFAVFAHGTVAILPDGLSDREAEEAALRALHDVFYAHVDMNPLEMKDGNVLVHYNHDVASVALKEVVDEHWREILQRYQEALATDELLITSLGPNKFDDVGKKALFARCYMFMDAQAPKVVRVCRKAI